MVNELKTQSDLIVQVPFGLTAGLAAIGNSKIVVVGGIAELISGAISMGVGGFLSAQSERGLPEDFVRSPRAEILHIRRSLSVLETQYTSKGQTVLRGRTRTRSNRSARMCRTG